MNPLNHSLTADTSETPFIFTLCTYWALTKPDQRALIRCISEWRSHRVGTKHTNKAVCKVTGFNACVWEFVSVVCGCVLEFGVWTVVHIRACVCAWCCCSWCSGTVLVTVTLLFSRGWWMSEGQRTIILFTLMREAGPSSPPPTLLSLSLSFMFSLWPHSMFIC